MQNTIVNRLYATVCARVSCFTCNIRMKCRTSFSEPTSLLSLQRVWIFWGHAVRSIVITTVILWTRHTYNLRIKTGMKWVCSKSKTECLWDTWILWKALCMPGIERIRCVYGVCITGQLWWLCLVTRVLALFTPIDSTKYQQHRQRQNFSIKFCWLDSFSVRVEAVLTSRSVNHQIQWFFFWWNIA